MFVRSVILVEIFFPNNLIFSKFFFQKKCFLQNYFCARARCAREILRSPRFQQYPTSRYLRPKSQFFAPSARARCAREVLRSPRFQRYPTSRYLRPKNQFFAPSARARARCAGRARVPGSRRFQRYMTCGPRCPGTPKVPRDHPSM